MDFQEIKRNVVKLKAEAETLATSVIYPQHKKDLEIFTPLIATLSDFFSDDQNVRALSEYDGKSDANKDKYPLDILCKNLFAELRVIEPLLSTNVLDYMRLENQQATPIRHNIPAMTAISNALNTLFAKNLLSVFETLKYLSGHNKTLIVLGANGSGKTSFANHLKNIEKHVKVIPASKPIKAMGHTQYNATFEEFRNALFAGGDLQEDLLQKLITGICTECYDVAHNYFKTDVKGNTIFEKVKRIFDDFFDVKLDDSGFKDRQMQAIKAGTEPFPFNNMSDGERVAFFYIATVLVAEPQSFIVVDEPENHLNPAIYNKIWDRLIKERGDCQFIFISHTMEFINARSDFELVKIKDFKFPNTFEFEFLGSALENLKSDFIVEIVGSRKPILFCEGSKTDYDYKVYEILFGNTYTVIPTGNCVDVVNSVVACNNHANRYSIQKAVGIIDSDLKSDEEITRMRAKRISTLKCNEIEMLLLDKAIFKKVLAQIGKQENTFNDFKNAFFTKLAEEKQRIIKRLVKTHIDEKLRSSVIDDKSHKTQEQLKENLASIFDGINVNALWAEYDAKITDIITRNDYDSALKYCCLEHNEIIVGVGKPFVTDYTTIALVVLKDGALVTEIRMKYFPDFAV